MTNIDSLRAAAIAAARADIGYREKPRNIVKYWTILAPSLQGAPYCGAGATYWWKQAGIDLRPLVNPYSASALMRWAKSIGAWKTSGQNDADISIMGFGSSTPAHIGLAWPDSSAKGRRQIEANTSPGSAGSQANGGGVYQRYRGAASIIGYVDMARVIAHYRLAGTGAAQAAVQAAAPVIESPTGALVTDGIAGRATVREIQERLREVIPGVVVDGKAGPQTVTALQAWFDLPVRDGIISGQNATCRAAMPGFRGDVIQLGKGGSRFGRNLQAYAGVTVDGLLGRGTWTQVQRMLNAYPAFLTREDFGVADQRLRAAGLR